MQSLKNLGAMKERDEMSQKKSLFDVLRGGWGASEIINEALKSIMSEQEEFSAANWGKKGRKRGLASGGGEEEVNTSSFW